LFRPDCVIFQTPDVVRGEGDIVSSLQYLLKHGKFTLFNFTEPIGNKAEGVFRLEYTYIPNGVNLSFSNVHLIHVRISSTGLITFIGQLVACCCLLSFLKK
jgi:hypothetical protein